MRHVQKRRSSEPLPFQSKCERRESPASADTDGGLSSEDSSDVSENQLELDLRRTSRKHNLTQRNVRNILREVITHEKVVDMMKAAIRDTQDLPLFEPKMTRSRLKQAVELGQKVNWSLPGVAATNRASGFVDMDLEEEEDTSDEEYCPDEEEEEDTDEMLLSDGDSLASPLRLSCPQTPVQTQVHTPVQTPVGTTQGTTGTAADPGTTEPFSDPLTDSFIDRLNAVEEELNCSSDFYYQEDPLACRTRSKLPLVDVPINRLEAELLDFTADMYSSPTPKTRDPHWTQWLQGLLAPENTEEAEDEDDPEYNFLEDVDELDMEDYRTDRAVQITKKEVNELLEEFFETLQEQVAEEEERDEEEDSCLSGPEFKVPESVNAEEQQRNVTKPSQQRRVLQDTTNTTQPPAQNQSRSQGPQPQRSASQGPQPQPRPSATQGPQPQPSATQGPQPQTSASDPVMQTETLTLQLSDSQRKHLQQQIQQHVQLLTQVHLLTKDIRALHHEASITRNFLGELDLFSRRSSSPDHSSFSVCNLQPALELITETTHSDPHCPPAVAPDVAPKRWLPSMVPVTSGHSFPVLPSQLAWVFATRPVFPYPELLPVCSLDPALYSGHSRQLYTAGEDGLIVLGLKHFQGSLKTEQILTEFLICKTHNHLRRHLWEMCSLRAVHNVIKSFCSSGRVPPLPVACSSVDPLQLCAPVDRSCSHSPNWLKNSREIIQKTRLFSSPPSYPLSPPPGCTLRLHPHWLPKTHPPPKTPKRRLFTLAHNATLKPLAKRDMGGTQLDASPPAAKLRQVLLVQPLVQTTYSPPEIANFAEPVSEIRIAACVSLNRTLQGSGRASGGPTGGGGESGGEGDANGDATGEANGDANGEANGDANADTNGNSRRDANEKANGDANGNSKGDAKGNANGDANDNANGEANGDANGEAISDANADTNGNSKGDANRNAKGDANGGANSDANGEANSDANADTNGNSKGDANGDANGNANADTNGNSKSDANGVANGDGGGGNDGQGSGEGGGGAGGSKDGPAGKGGGDEGGEEEEEEEEFDDLTQDEDEEEVMSSASEESVLSVPELQETMKQLTWLAAERRLGDADSEEDLSQEDEEEDEEEGQAKEEEEEEVKEEPGAEVRGDEETAAGEEEEEEEAVRGAETGPARGRGRCRPRRHRRRPQDRLSKDASKLLLLYDENILEKDPHRESKDTAFAQGYLSRVYEALQDSPLHIEQFVSLMSQFESVREMPGVVSLFRRLQCILGQHTDLLRDFAAFLRPEQALECGLFEEQQAFDRSRRFLRQLEISFGENPSHYHKIIKALQMGPDLSPTSVCELRAQMTSLLKGHSHLQSELWVFFDDLHPPPAQPGQFEEAQWPEETEGREGRGVRRGGGDGGGFEEVTLPELEEEEDRPKLQHIPVRQRRKDDKCDDWSGKPWMCLCHDASNISKHQKKKCPRCKGLRVVSRAMKSLHPLYSQMSCEKEASPQQELSVACWEDEDKEEKDDTAGLPSSDCPGPPPVSSIAQGSPTPSPTQTLSPPSPLDSPSAAETPPSAAETPPSAAETPPSAAETPPSAADPPLLAADPPPSTADPPPSAADPPPSAADPPPSAADHPPSAADPPSSSADPPSSAAETPPSAADPPPSAADPPPSPEDPPPSAAETPPSEPAVCAKNMSLTSSGEKVILWTRDADRVILTRCQQEGANPNTFHQVSTELRNKTPEQVSQRFQDLMRLFHTTARTSNTEEPGLNQD